MAGVKFKSVSKRWGDVVGVRDLDLDVIDQEFLVLLGPSGCGKTTTMRMVAGLEDPSGGEIWIGDDLANDMPPRERDVAMVFQNYGLYPHMSVRDNIGYPLKVRGIAKAKAREMVDAAAAKVELGPYLERRPGQLSGGQRQRVALARSLVRTPRVFLMDEPLSNLDAKLRVTMRAELKHLHHELAITTIYVTHDQIEAMTLAHRVAVMSEGVIKQLATPSVIYDQPANLFVAAFIGSPAMNLISGALEDGAFVAPGIRIGNVGEGTRAAIVLGVRPEDTTVTAPGVGEIAGAIYASELTGDSVLVTANAGPARIIAKADRAYRGDVGANLGLTVNRSRLHLFDKSTTERIVRPGGAD